jgi:hypothetical protein
MSNASYPYIASGNETCKFDDGEVVVRISGTVSAVRSAAGLKAALLNGPASMSLHGSSNSFR